MGRLGTCLAASLVLHGFVWAIVAARFSSWKLAVAAAAPPEPIEVEAVSEVAPAPGAQSGGGGARPVTTTRARAVRPRSQTPVATVATEPESPVVGGPSDVG